MAINEHGVLYHKYIYKDGILQNDYGFNKKQ